MVWEEQNESCLQKHQSCLRWMYFQGDTHLPDGISSCQKHTEGVTGVAALQLERSPGWVPVPAFPTPGAPQEMHIRMMHFTTMSSKGTFLLPALPERNCVIPRRFWESKPLSISCFPTACQAHVCPLSTEQPQPLTEQPQPLTETWIVFAFPFWGFASSPSQNKHVSACFPAPLYQPKD